MIKNNNTIYTKKNIFDMTSRPSLDDFGQEIFWFFQITRAGFWGFYIFYLIFDDITFDLCALKTFTDHPNKHRFTVGLHGLSRIQKVAEGPDTRPSRWR